MTVTVLQRASSSAAAYWAVSSSAASLFRASKLLGKPKQRVMWVWVSERAARTSRHMGGVIERADPARYMGDGADRAIGHVAMIVP